MRTNRIVFPSSIPWKQRRRKRRTTAVSSVITIALIATVSSPFGWNSFSRHYCVPVASAFTIHASFGSGPKTTTTGGTPPASTLITTTTLTRPSTTTTNLLDDYDAFILDQFGVLHNGKAALPGAHALIAEMVRRKKPLIILSNTSSPAQATLARLHTTLHFPAPQQFLTAITSGEEAIHYLQHTYTYTNTNTNTKKTNTNEEEEDATTGTTAAASSSRNHNRNRNRICKFIWFTWDTQTNTNVPDPMQFIHHLNNPKKKKNKNNDDDDDNDNDDDDDDDDGTVIFEPTLDIEAAEFVVAHGCNVIRGSSMGGDATTTTNENVQSVGNFLVDGQFTNGIDTILAQCAQRHLPLICANPDFVVKYHDGTKKQMPGQIAHRYSTKFHMADHTKLFGKPHPEHFEACLHALYQHHQQNQNEDNDNNNKDDTPASSSLQPPSKPVLRIAHVGDSIQHDVAGANAVAGIDSIFIMGGIHSDVFDDTTTTTTTTTTTITATATAGVEDETTKGILSERRRLQNFFEHEGHTPTHVVPMFRL